MFASTTERLAATRLFPTPPFPPPTAQIRCLDISPRNKQDCFSTGTRLSLFSEKGLIMSRVFYSKGIKVYNHNSEMNQYGKLKRKKEIR
jgi:hypothetical protein